MEMMQMQMQQMQQLPGVAPQSDEVAELRRQLAAAEEQLHGEAQVADISLTMRVIMSTQPFWCPF